MIRSTLRVRLKRSLKRGAQIALAACGPLAWPARDRSLLVLAYHRVLPPGDERLLTEQPGMWVHPETFRLHLRILKRHFEMMRLSEWLRRAQRGDALPPRACAITFDDGWRDNYEFAYPILREETVPATLFLCSDLVGGDGVFWPERLAALLRFMVQRGLQRRSPAWISEVCPSLQARERLDVDVIDQAICTAKARYRDEDLGRRVDEAIAALGMPVSAVPRALLNWSEVGEMLASGLIEAGSHTRRHIRVSDSMGEEALRDEIEGSRRVIEEKTGRPIDLFCYPNGDVSARAHALVKAAYRGACSTMRGWHGADDDPFMIRRIGIHEGCAFDRAAFTSRIAVGL